MLLKVSGGLEAATGAGLRGVTTAQEEQPGRHDGIPVPRSCHLARSSNERSPIAHFMETPTWSPQTHKLLLSNYHRRAEPS